MELWSQKLRPARQTVLSTPVCAVPVLILLGGHGFFQMRAHIAALAGFLGRDLRHHEVLPANHPWRCLPWATPHALFRHRRDHGSGVRIYRMALSVVRHASVGSESR